VITLRASRLTFLAKDMTTTVGRPTPAQNLSALVAEIQLRILNVSRYPGQLVLEIIIPIVFAAMPILLGRATAGQDAAANFQTHTGTANYVAYLLIGANVFSIVSFTFGIIARWLRFEQETGTLEAVFLAPTSPLVLLIAVSIYAAMRGLTTSLIAYFVGCLVFRINPLQGDVLLALAFILAGLIPLFGVSALFGAVVLKVKESNALLGLMQWVLSFLMGIFFPVAVLPPFVRFLALLFPPTWMNNGVRSALLGVGFFFGEWYLDMAVLWAFMLAAPAVGFWVFTRVERGIQRNEGVGQF
jgi:ABC-2 type transport system permease protein